MTCMYAKVSIFHRGTSSDKQYHDSTAYWTLPKDPLDGRKCRRLVPASQAQLFRGNPNENPSTLAYNL